MKLLWHLPESKLSAKPCILLQSHATRFHFVSSRCRAAPFSCPYKCKAMQLDFTSFHLAVGLRLLAALTNAKPCSSISLRFISLSGCALYKQTTELSFESKLSTSVPLFVYAWLCLRKVVYSWFKDF
mgnify:CR=1 FL=1